MLGGLLTPWKIGKMDVLNNFKGDGFLEIKILWKNSIYYVDNIYSSCDLSKKKRFWNNLLLLKENFKDGKWIMGGDFNTIKNNSERKGRAEVVNYNKAKLFAEFINKSSFMDITCKGKKFTWYSRDGKSMSRIYLFLLSDNMVNK